jgi:hypothetical protein
MRAARLWLASTIVLAVAATARADRAGIWDSYSNPRYGYRICYPANVLKPLPEADNGDGRVFRSSDGAELRVFGTNNALETSLAEEAKSQASSYRGRRGRITYHRLTPRWDVTSGDDGGSFAFYNKIYRRADQFVEFQLKYPRAKAERYKLVIERLSRCFALLKPAF